MRHLILALMLVAWHHPLAAQDSALVRLTVSTATGPVSDALVQSGTLIARTDQSGFAALRLAEGTRILTVAKIGYVPDTLSLNLRPALDTLVPSRSRVRVPPSAQRGPTSNSSTCGSKRIRISRYSPRRDESWRRCDSGTRRPA